MRIFKEFTFDAAHQLPNVPDGHKCGRMHGHTYKVRVEFEGSVDPFTGWIVDFGDVKQIWNALEETLDHRTLNNVIENPTAENLATYIYRYFAGWCDNEFGSEVLVESVTVWETPTAGATVSIDDEEVV